MKSSSIFQLWFAFAYEVHIVCNVVLLFCFNFRIAIAYLNDGRNSGNSQVLCDKFAAKVVCIMHAGNC